MRVKTEMDDDEKGWVVIQLVAGRSGDPRTFVAIFAFFKLW